MEGLLDRLLNPADPIAAKVLMEATFYIIPNVNPDGSFRGHLRTNAGGANLNREWAPTGECRAQMVCCRGQHRSQSGPVSRVIPALSLTLSYMLPGSSLTYAVLTAGSYMAPTLERSPEVYHVLHESIKIGCDFFLDVHGDEAIPHNFLTSMMGNPR